MNKIITINDSNNETIYLSKCDIIIMLSYVDHTGNKMICKQVKDVFGERVQNKDYEYSDNQTFIRNTLLQNQKVLATNSQSVYYLYTIYLVNDDPIIPGKDWYYLPSTMIGPEMICKQPASEEVLKSVYARKIIASTDVRLSPSEPRLHEDSSWWCGELKKQWFNGEYEDAYKYWLENQVPNLPDQFLKEYVIGLNFDNGKRITTTYIKMNKDADGKFSPALDFNKCAVIVKNGLVESFESWFASIPDNAIKENRFLLSQCAEFVYGKGESTMAWIKEHIEF